MNDSTPVAQVPDSGSPQSPVGGAYKTIGTSLTVVVVGGLVWGRPLTVIKAAAAFTACPPPEAALPPAEPARPTRRTSPARTAWPALPGPPVRPDGPACP